MTYIITEPCIGVKDASCVDVCPVDCIHTTDEDPQFYIDPEECIDCGACEPACPVTAIFPGRRCSRGPGEIHPHKTTTGSRIGREAVPGSLVLFVVGPANL